MEKRGISAIVASVLIILITIAGVTILWAAVIPMIKNSIELSNLCFDAKLMIDGSSGYTCYDFESNVVSVSVSKGVSVGISKVDFAFIVDGNSHETSRTFSGGVNEGEVFYFVLDGDLEEIRVSPIVTNGRSEKVCDAVSITPEVKNCDINAAESNIENEYVAYWKLENDTSEVTERFDGTTAGIVGDTEGRNGIGRGLIFDGSGGYMGINDPINLQGKNFTISHWIKTTTILSQQYTVANTGNGNGYRFGVHAGDLQFLAGINMTNYTEQTCPSDIQINDGEWHMISGVFIYGDAFYGYVDGEFQCSVDIDAYPTMWDRGPRIGTSYCCHNYDGEIDEVGIYNRGLSADEIEQLYRLQKD